MPRNDLTMNGRKAIAHTQRRIDKHILRRPTTADTPATGYFNPDQWMSTISTSDLTAYTAHRLAEGASAASCNHELATIRRALRLAVRGGELVGMPHVPMLKLNNARQGFFERAEFQAILEAPARVSVRAAKVRFHHRLASSVGSVIDDGRATRSAGGRRAVGTGEDENNEGRSFYVTAELRDVLKAQLVALEDLRQHSFNTHVPPVPPGFHSISPPCFLTNSLTESYARFAVMGTSC